jgi:hypothetical protein
MPVLSDSSSCSQSERKWGCSGCLNWPKTENCIVIKMCNNLYHAKMLNWLHKQSFWLKLAGRFYTSRSDNQSYLKTVTVNAVLKYGKMELLDSGLLQAAKSSKLYHYWRIVGMHKNLFGYSRVNPCLNKYYTNYTLLIRN